jgi:small subunit ribosomal protein S14
MAKLSSILRDQKRERLIKKHEKKRAELRAKMQDQNLSPQEKQQVQAEFAKLPKNSCPTRLTRRCMLTGRRRGFYRKFGLSRIMLREKALLGQLPGVRKASW